MKALLAIVATLLAGGTLGQCSSARAHGDAEWIMNNPEYKRYDYKYNHCCGPDHCSVAPPGKFVDVPGGVMDTETQITYWRSNGTGVYVSKDDQWWWCWMHEQGKPVPVCIFKPYKGS